MIAFPDTIRAHGAFFSSTRPLHVARAPGRLDLMGGIADYSGSLVLQLPLADAAWAAVQWADEDPPTVRVRTTDAAAAHGSPDVTMPLDDLLAPYEAVRMRFAADRTRHWASYIAGAITVLHHERGLDVDRGVRWLVASSVPAGKGVSSSAAIEVAAMHALLAALGRDRVAGIDGRTLALLCQKVENLVAGAPCGVMDQMTAACGEAGSLLALRCQPAELEPSVRLPDRVEVFGIDSGIRHAVSGADYGSVRAGAFMGLAIIGVLTRPRDYLANVTTAEWEGDLRDRVPSHLTGADFLERYGASAFADRVMHIDPARRYAVRHPTAHPIYEHDRVRQFRALLASGSLTDEVLTRLGGLMEASHQSYTACGLGSDGTDRIVALVREAGPAQGVFGAKITGGGSGGTVAVLARRGSREAVDAIASRYARETGRTATVVSGSSDGAWRFGTSTYPPRSA